MRLMHGSLHVKFNQLGKQLNISTNQRESIDDNNNTPLKGAVKRPFRCAGQHGNNIFSPEIKAFTG